MADFESLLRVSNLTKTFGATRALNGVSVQFDAGEVHCLLGENGAGKSTLGKIIGGLYRPDDGEVEFAGRPVAFSSPREARAAGIAMVYQELSLAPHLSVRANLWLGAGSARFPLAFTSARHERERAVEVLHMLGVHGIDVERPVREFPVAVQQLIEIGKALMSRPRVIVFDEPTAMLGAIEKAGFFDVLRKLKETGIVAVMVTHHVDDVLAVGDRVTVMRNGSVVESFRIDAEVDSETIVTRLTGKRHDGRMQEAERRHDGEPALVIEGLPAPEGTRTLTIGKGEIVGLYGVVGCGAENLVRLLVGMAPRGYPDMAVAVRLDGHPYWPKRVGDALRQGVSWLPAGRAAHGILPDRSILENLLLTQLSGMGRLGFVRPSWERSRGAELIARYQVKLGRAADPITSLSGGNQQKVLVARAMASARRLLVLEEPTAGVDIDAKHAIHGHIRRLAQTGIAVLVLSSDLPETIGLCDTVVTLCRGKVVGLYRNPSERDQAAIISDVLGQYPGASSSSSLH